jgi:hypothetical protein
MHNNLAGLNGGTGSGATGEYYHLTSAQHAVATQAVTGSVNGFMVSADKTKLDGLSEFTGSFTSSNSTGFAWTDNTLAVTHNLSKQYVAIDLYDNNDVKCDYTVTGTSTSVATISFPIGAIPITGTYKIRIR